MVHFTKSILAITICVIGCTYAAQFSSDYVYDPIDKIIPGMFVPTQVMSLSFQVSLDPNTVHSHRTRMNWSKIRHSDEYDPADPTGSIQEPEDYEKRPSLCYTFIKRLANQLFTSLAAPLPLEDAQRVMSWKNEGAFEDIEPTCNVVIREELPIKDKDSNEVLVPEYKEEKEICNVDFLRSLFPYYGIGFNLTVSMRERPMSELTYEDILQRITPDLRGKTQPIRTTDANVEITLMSPDFTNEDIHSAAYRRREHLLLVESNVDHTIRKLLDRSRVLFGGAFPAKVHRRKMGTMEVELEHIPMYQKSESESKESLNDLTGIDLNVMLLCEEHDFTVDECRRLQKIFDSDPSLFYPEEDGEKDNLSKETDDKKKYNEERKKRQRLESEKTAEKSYDGHRNDGYRRKDMSEEEKLKMKKQFEDLDNFLSDFESEGVTEEESIAVEGSVNERLNDDANKGYDIDDLDMLMDESLLNDIDSQLNDIENEYDMNSMAEEL